MLSFPKQEDNRNGIDHYDSKTVHAWNALNKQIFFSKQNFLATRVKMESFDDN